MLVVMSNTRSKINLYSHKPVIVKIVSYVERKFIDVVHKYILNKIKPDITFLLKVNISKAFSRLKKRKNKNRYDKFSRSFYNNAQKAFIKLAKNNKNKYYIYDNSTDDKSLEEKILKVVLSKLK